MTPNLTLIYPMFAMVILTMFIAILMWKRRMTAIKEGFDPRYFKTLSVGQPPDNVLRVDRHYINLFEMPVLFYVGCIVAMIMPLAGPGILFWSWGFVVARVLHAFIHITTNKLPMRMMAFMLGFAMLVGMWIQIVISI